LDPEHATADHGSIRIVVAQGHIQRGGGIPDLAYVSSSDNLVSVEEVPSAISSGQWQPIAHMAHRCVGRVVCDQQLEAPFLHHEEIGGESRSRDLSERVHRSVEVSGDLFDVVSGDGQYEGQFSLDADLSSLFRDQKGGQRTTVRRWVDRPPAGHLLGEAEPGFGGSCAGAPREFLKAGADRGRVVGPAMLATEKCHAPLGERADGEQGVDPQGRGDDRSVGDHQALVDGALFDG
jgi:hypothetical protein